MKRTEHKANETTSDDTLEIIIPGTDQLDLKLGNVVFFKANEKLGAAAYKLLEDRVDAINHKYSDKITVILVPYSVNVESE